jgi:murein DD-endopeptidase MepM/ murein hydrolase activator NlpD
MKAHRWLFVLFLLAMFGLLFALLRARPAAPPVSAADSGSEPPGLQPKPMYSVRNEEVIEGVRFFIRNRVPAPIEAECEVESSAPVTADPVMPRRMRLPAAGERVLTTLRVTTEGRTQFAVSCRAVPGDPHALAPEGVTYALPFPAGTRYEISQGFGGEYSHNDAESRYAIDLAVPEGTSVLAARAGVVMQVENEFRAHGADLGKYGDRANYVLVLHDDGSMALYAHLAPGSAIVRPGDKVRVGDFLARSGNTGFTTGPHLHFGVQRNEGMALRSLRFGMVGVELEAK